jgi:hypothetical protein
LIPKYVLPQDDQRGFIDYSDGSLNLDLRYNYADPPYYLPYHIQFDVQWSIGNNPISFKMFTNDYVIDFEDSAFNFNQFTGTRIDISLITLTDLTSAYSLTISDTSDTVYFYRQSDSFEPTRTLILQLLTLNPTTPLVQNPFTMVTLSYMVPTL